MILSVYRTQPGNIVIRNESNELRSAADFSFNQLFQAENPHAEANRAFENGEVFTGDLDEENALPPIGDQEIWAAGVTYFRSRTARMEEAESVGGDVFYDKVYDATRPELFFKATASRARGNGAEVCIRPDSTWDVPEPELTLAINRAGKIFGYTIGNDMSSRSIEGENPLYLPQAKVYKGSCAIGPCLLLSEKEPSKDAAINLRIDRSGKTEFTGETKVGQLKRGLGELAEFLFHSNEFPLGAYLMTGTGIVPDSEFTLQAGDEIEISIEGIGTLRNTVAVA